tara:strand:+ start:335 stop:502 length:168 start_codon:yes stop_codon:yes gene_type:complete
MQSCTGAAGTMTRIEAARGDLVDEVASSFVQTHQLPEDMQAPLEKAIAMRGLRVQ